MNDPFLNRDWADNHARFNGDLGRALTRFWRAVKVSFDVLKAYEYDAPWERVAKRRRKPRGASVA